VRVEAAIERYLATPPRAPETMFDHLYATLPKSYASQRDEIKGAPHGGGDAVEAVNLALARALAEDPAVVVLGEDVGVNGGVFRATVGLQKRFGPERVIDTPLAELLISGLCVGDFGCPFTRPRRRRRSRGGPTRAMGGTSQRERTLHLIRRRWTGPAAIVAAARTQCRWSKLATTWSALARSKVHVRVRRFGALHKKSPLPDRRRGVLQ
jgi:hypothetical protein